MIKAKIHRATVTQADLNYVGSLTIDKELMELCDILPNEQVHVLNVTNGARMVTYAIEGERGSGVMCLNGAARATRATRRYCDCHYLCSILRCRGARVTATRGGCRRE